MFLERKKCSKLFFYKCNSVKFSDQNFSLILRNFRGFLGIPDFVDLEESVERRALDSGRWTLNSRHCC